MFTWVANFFNRNSNAHPLLEDMTMDEFETIMEKFELEEAAINERRHMQFICALSRELFPGDNSAVDRIERAISTALSSIAD